MNISIKTLDFDDIKILVDKGEIKFTERYNKKFKLWQKEN